MDFHIRRATADDADTIHALIRGLAEFEREPDAVKTTALEIASQLSQEPPPFECYLAETTSEPTSVLGFALLFQSYSTWLGKPGLYLEDLFVWPEHRRKGVGKELFLHGARLAVERGHGRYEWAALDWNSQAIDFYRSFGAISMDEWTTYRLSGDALRRAAQTE